MADVELHSVQVEYRGSPVPLPRPRLHSVQIEYVHDPLTTGTLEDGVVTTVFSRTGVEDTDLTSQITPADLLAYSQVSTDTNFDDESKWYRLLIQYLHRPSGQIRNVLHRKNGPVWTGSFRFTGTSELGRWTKRSIILRSTTGAELILLPTRFPDGESLVLQT